jgi:putative peptidoglycan lipid II flippase
MLKIFRNIAKVSLATILSRLLGLVRDALMLAALGAGLGSSAFILAFTLPNLFRRLLGEGALTSAVVPVLSQSLQNGNRSSAYSILNHVFSRLVCALCLLVILVCGGFYGLSHLEQLSERWQLCAELAVWTFPYVGFICLSALVVAALSVLGRFGAGAASPVLLNLSLISAMTYGSLRDLPDHQLLVCMVFGVLFGGAIQLLVPSLDLYRQGWRPKFIFSESESYRKVKTLFLPGLLGAGVVQLNLVLSRVLAHSLEDNAVSILFLASRLMELPLGVGTLAITTVFFPLLANSTNNSDSDAFSAVFVRGLRMVLALSIAAAAGLFLLREHLVRLLFEWGAFNSSDTALTAPLVGIYAACIPLYSCGGFCLRALHAQQEMRWPVRVAGVCLFVNLIGGWICMQFWGVVGLAFASLLAACVQAALMLHGVTKLKLLIRWQQLGRPLMHALVAACLMGLMCQGGLLLLDTFVMSGKASALLAVACVVPLGVVCYLLVLRLFRDEVVMELLHLLPLQKK